MTCSNCVSGICTNRCNSKHREELLADVAANHAIKAAGGQPTDLATARAYDVDLIRAHMPHMHPGRLEAAEATIRQITGGLRRYDDSRPELKREAA